MAQIGLKNLFYALIEEDENGHEVYGAPVRLAKAISAELSVETDTQTLYADDGADVTISEFQSGTLTLGVNDLGTTVAAELLGARIDANGVLISSGEDTPPAVAIGFQSRSAKGGDRYFWLQRVTFGIPGGTMNTKGESVEFSTPSIEGTISRRNLPDGEGRHPWKTEVKAGVTGVSQNVIDGWFDEVYVGEQGEDTFLTDITIGTESLRPVFSPEVLNYEVIATGSSAEITVQANSGTAGVVIAVNGNSITNGDTVTWTASQTIITITVTAGATTRRYTVTVNTML